MYYAITASLHYQDDDGWEHVHHMPTFYLHSHVQGILNEDHARRVATNMLYDAVFIRPSETDVRITVTAVEQGA
jgi:hypothetical protein